MLTVKIVIIGDTQVGKTSLSMRYADQTFQYEYIKTIGTNFFMKNITFNNSEATLMLWDLAGDEPFGKLRPLFYQGAFGALLVFDVTNHTSFTNLKKWLTELRDNVPQKISSVLVANKMDLPKTEWRVSESEIQSFANDHELPYFMTSAKDTENVNPAFSQLIKDMGNFIPDITNSEE